MNTFVTLLGERLRRDRVQLPLWILGTAALAALTHSAVGSTYGTETDRAALLATVAANPVIMLFRGLPSGAGEGAFTMFLILPFLAMLAAFMSSFLAVRHTRADEETGRAELIAATAAGRSLPLLATTAHGTLANLALALLTAAALIASGLPPTGAVVAGSAAGTVGLALLGVGLLGGQLFRTSRGANSFAVIVLITTFFLSGIGNALGTPSADLQRIDSSWLAWISPFGWAEQSRPFSDDNPWPLALGVAIAIALAVASLALQSVRDLGESFVAERRGPAHAGPVLSGSMGLVWRLTRGAILIWSLASLATGLLATTLAGVVGSASSDVPSIQAILQALSKNGSVEQGTVVVFFTMLGILAASCAVQIVCRARQEEAAGTTELLLSAPVGRVRWLAGYVVLAFAGIILTVAAAVLGAALGLTSRRGDWTLMDDVLVTGAGQVAAASVFLVVTALIFVVAPRVTIALGWTLVLVGMILGLFGPLFGFPEWLVHLSPIGVAPTVTADGADLKGLWWLIAAVAVGAGAALTLMRRRELAPAG